MIPYKTGKAPARKGAVSFQFRDFFDAKKLPKPPAVFGHYAKVGNFHMLANDQFGNCVWAGAAHEHMIWSVEGGRARNRFTITDVLSDYAAVTGFDKSQTDAHGENPTDQGTDMSLAASYRRKTGVIDATNTRRRIDGYLALEAGNWDQLIVAMYLFGACGIGVQLPQSALDQFDKHQPWTVPWFKTKIVGGHYVCGVGRDAKGNVPIVSWGGVNPMTQKWYERFNDETLCYFSLDVLNAKNLSPEGFDADELRKHMANLKGSK